MSNNPPRCRPFRLLDGMILVAAAAVWIALMRPRWEQMASVVAASGRGVTWRVSIWMIQQGVTVSLWMLVLAYLTMRLVRPRPAGADLFRQPGMLLLGIMAGLILLAAIVSEFAALVPWTEAVLTLLLALPWYAACRRFRPRAEPGWIEGVGRAMGVGWIVLTAATYPLYLLTSP